MSLAKNAEELGRKSSRLSVANEDALRQASIRRSTRDPSAALLERNDVKRLLKRIRQNSRETLVLKIKDQILADVNDVVFEAILQALWKNTNCQGLYIQNLGNAIGDEQLEALGELLQKKMIWCLNIGETYNVSTHCWRSFCDNLHLTNVTHLYVSEHVISNELKNDMRYHIRENRKKHDLHCAFKNIRVIERMTNCWWNPINGVKELKPPPPIPPPAPEVEEEIQYTHIPIVLAPHHTEYWQKGHGAGGETAWTFKCSCGERCSHTEMALYHPKGETYECSNPACRVWSHVKCVLGEKVTIEEAGKMKITLCSTCKSKSRRDPHYLDAMIIPVAAPAPARAAPARTAAKPTEDTEGVWSFKCKCGDLCSSYEKALNHPDGQWYSCTQCSVWGHVTCNFGEKTTPEQVLNMPQALCMSCLTKNRRNRHAPAEPQPQPSQEMALLVTWGALEAAYAVGGATEVHAGAGAGADSADAQCVEGDAFKAALVAGQPAATSTGMSSVDALDAAFAVAVPVQSLSTAPPVPMAVVDAKVECVHPKVDVQSAPMVWPGIATATTAVSEKRALDSDVSEFDSKKQCI
ncbi:hypothetical protein B484DRAFT_445617 [Ochromonadaceae sp. CCMP2298]|nr:hypothetical protein B484DRAFT_445617 [Ochromonadaceae sp. CCMP2298]